MALHWTGSVAAYYKRKGRRATSGLFALTKYGCGNGHHHITSLLYNVRQGMLSRLQSDKPLHRMPLPEPIRERAGEKGGAARGRGDHPPPAICGGSRPRRRPRARPRPSACCA